ncbi:MAG: 16S rRNA (cytosine(1402)-N(4))-methyltransferase RsmH [Blastochloris sp.]|nr:16S rRNA (cytosine(1402)-N(4))-methyltransferase RsmH [Blastochloris sp.]
MSEKSVVSYSHEPVLLKEVLEILSPKKNMLILDATFGRGGHSQALLDQGCGVLAFDRDPEAVAAAEKMKAARGDDLLKIQRGNFAQLSLDNALQGTFDGILMDLGVSSPQLDQAERGFSFQQDGPLDMRMDPEKGVSAADLVNQMGEADIAQLIWRLGEESQSRKIAAHIVKERQLRPIETTLHLAALVEKAVGGRKGSKIHPATKTFQALRMAVNEELESLEIMLQSIPSLLKKGGRLAVISFHALEDRRVKSFIHKHSQEEIRGDAYAFGVPNKDYCLKKLGRWLPEQEEIKRNVRSRSARLRGAEKIS